MKTLTPVQITAIELDINMLLHASRDCYRNKGEDATKFQFNVSDTYYAEAYGILRALKTLNYGKFNTPTCPEDRTNLSWWFDQLKKKVLQEENFGGNGECDYCLVHFGKDDAGRTRECLMTDAAGQGAKNGLR